MSKVVKKRKLGTRVLATAGLFLGSISTAFANTTGGQSMPWDGPLQTLVNNLSGPTAGIVMLIGIILSGYHLIKGDHGRGLHLGFGTVAGGALMMFGPQIMSILGLSGAVL